MKPSPTERGALERYFEQFLWSSRLMLVPAVLASIIAAAIMIIAGCADVVLLAGKLPMLLDGSDGIKMFNSQAILLIIAAIDVFLIATVLLIFGIGLYELFISQIDEIDDESRSSGVLDVHSLDQLKEKLGKVIIMVLVVSFFKAAMELTITGALDLLMLGGGIVLCALALFIASTKMKAKSSNHPPHED